MLRLNATPAHAPESADSQGRMRASFEEDSFPSRRAKRREATNSLVQNQAAVPPVSRMSVPVWPSQRPPKPLVRTTDVRTVRGPGRLVVALGVVVTSICTCILHLTSSIGVLDAIFFKSLNEVRDVCGLQEKAGYGP